MGNDVLTVPFGCCTGVNSETTAKRLVPDEPIPELKQSVEGEKEAEEKAARPASEKNEASASKEEL